MAKAICTLSSACFGKLPIGEAIRNCLELGARAVELSAPHPYQPLENHIALLETLRADGIPLVLHNYFPAPVTPFVLNPAATGADRDAALALVRDAATLAAAAAAPVYAIHAGYLGKGHAGSGGEFDFTDRISYAVALERAVDFFSEVAPFFESVGVTLAVENLFPSPKQRHSLCCDFTEISEFLSAVPSSVGFLLDLGHLNVSATVLGFDRQDALERCLAVFGPRIVEVHLSENNGERDEHLAVLDGSWQLSALAAIHKIPPASGAARVYTLEARRAPALELRRSLELISLALAT